MTFTSKRMSYFERKIFRQCLFAKYEKISAGEFNYYYRKNFEPLLDKYSDFYWID